MIYRAARTSLLDFVRKRRPGSACVYRICRVLVGAYENDSTRPEKNGEHCLLAKLSQRRLDMFFDVGANVGDWTLYARRLFPAARFHCFEPVAETARKLRERVGAFAQVTPAAMSARGGQTVIRSFAHDSSIATLTPLDALRRGRNESSVGVERRCKLMTGDDYCRSREIERVDFLKIDTEGHDLDVLKGFQGMLFEKRIGIVQFEHNQYAAMNRVFLRDFFDLLANQYHICQLLPFGLKSLEYTVSDEHYRMRTFVALPKWDASLRGLLSD